jgi:hypothetical protein
LKWLLREELLCEQHKAESGKGEARETLGVLSEPRGEPASQAKTELPDDESLECDQDDDEHGGEAEQAERETDRKFVEADADAEDERAEAACLREPGEPLLLVLSGGHQRVDAEGEQNSDGDVVGCSADRVSERVPRARPMSGIPPSKAVNKSEIRSQRADETPIIPSAAATANVSRPSGRTSATSFAITA